MAELDLGSFLASMLRDMTADQLGGLSYTTAGELRGNFDRSQRAARAHATQAGRVSMSMYRIYDFLHWRLGFYIYIGFKVLNCYVVRKYPALLER